MHLKAIVNSNVALFKVTGKNAVSTIKTNICSQWCHFTVWKHHNACFLSYGQLGICFHIFVTKSMVTIHKDNPSLCHLLAGLQQNTVKLGMKSLGFPSSLQSEQKGVALPLLSIEQGHQTSPPLCDGSPEHQYKEFFGLCPRVRRWSQIASEEQYVTILILKSNRSVCCECKDMCVCQAHCLGGNKSKKAN